MSTLRLTSLTLAIESRRRAKTHKWPFTSYVHLRTIAFPEANEKYYFDSQHSKAFIPLYLFLVGLNVFFLWLLPFDP